MAKDTRETRADAALLAWGLPPAEAQDLAGVDPGSWLAGGAFLLLWTAVAMLLTA